MPKRTKTTAHPRPSPPAAPASSGKLSTLIAHLRRREGATLAQLADATVWKPLSVRSALAGALKARGQTARAEGMRIYLLPSAEKAHR